MKRSKPAVSPRKGINTRITDDLRAALDAAAAKNDRTLGAEIEHRLKASFATDDFRTIIREEIRVALQRDRALSNLAEIDAPLLGLPGLR